MSAPHLDVIPRIIDSSIAINYQPETQKKEPTKAVPQSNVINTNNSPLVVPLTFTQKFFNTLKDYMIPIIFIITIIAIVYIIWKYWTTYRNSEPTKSNELTKNGSSDNPIDPLLNSDNIQSKEDLSQYIIPDIEEKQEELEEESDDSEEEEEDEDESVEEDESEGEDEPEESEGEEETKSVISEPDFSAISNLINQPIEEYASDRFEFINSGPLGSKLSDPDPDYSIADSIQTEMDIEETKSESKPKKNKKNKRIVL